MESPRSSGGGTMGDDDDEPAGHSGNRCAEHHSKGVLSGDGLMTLMETPASSSLGV